MLKAVLEHSQNKDVEKQLNVAANPNRYGPVFESGFFCFGSRTRDGKKKNRQENDKKCFVVAELGDAEVVADTHSPPSLSLPLSFPSLSVIWA